MALRLSDFQNGPWLEVRVLKTWLLLDLPTARVLLELGPDDGIVRLPTKVVEQARLGFFEVVEEVERTDVLLERATGIRFRKSVYSSDNREAPTGVWHGKGVTVKEHLRPRVLWVAMGEALSPYGMSDPSLEGLCRQLSEYFSE